jgi:hypothetical protein
MSDEQHASPQTAGETVELESQPSPRYQETEPQDGWLEERDAEDPPRRPRRRLLAPVPVALLLALLTACGFIGGVLVEKGSATSTAGTSSGAPAARFAGLRGAVSGAAAGGGGSGTSGATATGGPAAGASTGAGGPGGATAGTVAFVQGSTLYVTNAEGNTVKVKTSAASTVSKTVKSTVAAIHPGESVVITGASAANGAITAESIRVGGTGAPSLFGGGGGGGAAGTSAGGAAAAKGAPTLFGPG